MNKVFIVGYNDEEAFNQLAALEDEEVAKELVTNLNKSTNDDNFPAYYFETKISTAEDVERDFKLFNVVTVRVYKGKVDALKYDTRYRRVEDVPSVCKGVGHNHLIEDGGNSMVDEYTMKLYYNGPFSQAQIEKDALEQVAEYKKIWAELFISMKEGRSNEKV